MKIWDLKRVSAALTQAWIIVPSRAHTPRILPLLRFCHSLYCHCISDFFLTILKVLILCFYCKMIFLSGHYIIVKSNCTTIQQILRSFSLCDWNSFPLPRTVPLRLPSSQQARLCCVPVDLCDLRNSCGGSMQHFCFSDRFTHLI